MTTQTILSGTVGSTAYGLDREGSDIDTLEVHVRRMREIFAIGYLPQKDTLVEHEPADKTSHELGKYMSLVTKCNPTVMELLWLPEDLYNHVSWAGQRLIDHRDFFLNTIGVRNAYGGYARQQLHKLMERSSMITFDTMQEEWTDAATQAHTDIAKLDIMLEVADTIDEATLLQELINETADRLRWLSNSIAKAQKNWEEPTGTFDSDTRGRTAKHARHCMRLARQGKHLLQTGELFIRVPDPEEYWAFDDMDVEEMVKKLQEGTADINDVPSVLPEHWDVEASNALLYELRIMTLGEVT